MSGDDRVFGLEGHPERRQNTERRSNTTLHVSVKQSVIIAAIHAAVVAGIVYATQTAGIEANQTAIENLRGDLLDHSANDNRHGNYGLITYQLGRLQADIAEIKNATVGP